MKFLQCRWFLLAAMTVMMVMVKSISGLNMISFNLDKNISDVAIALMEIINTLKPKQLGILVAPPNKYNDCLDTDDDDDQSAKDNLQQHINDFIYQLHKLCYKSVIFYDMELFFQYIEASLQGSIESVNLIFCKPYDLSTRIQERKLSHRLSLFIFYWGALRRPRAETVRFEEPIRAVVITRPREKAIYYNQAVPTGISNLRLVNWYDGDNLGLHKVPLLPPSASVYSNFNGRVFKVPVFHSPPWFWVNYANDTSNGTAVGMEDDGEDYFYDTNSDSELEYTDSPEINVTGGRDHRLLCLLAEHMNFKFVYVEAPGRTQGSLRADGDRNETFTGGISLLQKNRADFLLGDVSLSWERRKAVEFSFFTLADSGAFATHAPRRLNEALAVIRPFKRDVWPYLILTVVFSGPIFYAIIAIPYKWRMCGKASNDRDVEIVGGETFYMVYIREITTYVKASRNPLLYRRAEGEGEGLPRNLFDRCIWFTVQLFLKQSCQELYHGYRAKFLMIVYWIAATYVLADVYSAQLTSQFARPAHEPPINTLYGLQRAMIEDGYQLFVEKESSSLEMLENGTEIFRHLFALMKQQSADEQGYLIDSVEAGIKLIDDGLENKVVLGGRETLFFNMQQFGSKNFQLSQKLYTRYSAVAVQIGCPFLDSLNQVLIHLFEGGILDKMTTAEYEAQSRMIGKEISDQKGSSPSVAGSNSVAPVEDETSAAAANADAANGKSSDHSEDKPKALDQNQVIQPLNLRMLQGAFIILIFGYAAAGVMFILELLCHRSNCNFLSRGKAKIADWQRWALKNIRRLRVMWRMRR